jgi:glycosyltransferase involved in cell wall biosynthesis
MRGGDKYYYFNLRDLVEIGLMSKKAKIIICMPTFNEAVGIRSFLDDIFLRMAEFDLRVIIVDDKSTDGTAKIAKSHDRAFEIECVENPENVGHGASTLRALGLALDSTPAPDVIVATDGDGHVLAEDLAKLANKILAEDYNVAEGIRFRGNDPWFRRVVTLFTRLLVFLASGSSPRDANTPFRAYKSAELRRLIGLVDSKSPVPNLVISALTRVTKTKYSEVQLSDFTRQSSAPTGSTWRQKIRWLPSMRFVKFCIRAMTSWINDQKRIRKILR